MTQPVNAAHSELVLLRHATRLVYAAVFHRHADAEAVTPERLAGIAHAMAALVPIYVGEGNDARRLAPEELAGAIVRRGGAELHFSDGRPVLRQLHVSRTGIDHVIQLLGGEAAGTRRSSVEPVCSRL